MTQGQEILPPALTRTETNTIERHALGAYGRGQQAMILFAADVAKLQEGSAHRIRGYTNFGEYIEHKFEGIRAGNAMQYARMGKVLLVLERNGRIRIEGNKDQLPATTGVRDLATILGKYGEESMLKVYDRAAESGRKVIPQSIQAAMQELVGPPEAAQLAPAEEPPEENPEEDEAGYTEEHSELLDRLTWLRQRLDNVQDAIAEGSDKDALFQLASLIEEARQVEEQIQANGGNK